MSCSLLIALAAWLAPQRMPGNIDALLWYSLPLAALWLTVFAIAVLRLRRKSLWLLVGAPFALHWPIWLLLNGIPTCYWTRSCI